MYMEFIYFVTEVNPSKLKLGCRDRFAQKITERNTIFHVILTFKTGGQGFNCPLSGPPGLRSNLGGEAVSTRGNSLAVLCVHNTVCTLYNLTGLLS